MAAVRGVAAPQLQFVSGELFAMMYGCTVNLLLQEGGGTNPAASTESMEKRCADVNDALFQMGKRIGIRIVDEFLAKTRGDVPCATLDEAVRTIATKALPMFFPGMEHSTRVDVLVPGEKFLLTLDARPLQGVAELPAPVRDHLWYCNVLCGAISSALNLVELNADVAYEKCTLRGHDCSQIMISKIKTG
jgi:hypothetical protein